MNVVYAQGARPGCSMRAAPKKSKNTTVAAMMPGSHAWRRGPRSSVLRTALPVQRTGTRRLCLPRRHEHINRSR